MLLWYTPMYMSLQTDIKQASIEALKAKDEMRLQVLRAISTSITNELVAQKKKPDAELSDDEVLAVIKRESKKRKDAFEQFSNAGRTDLASVEQAELEILEEYLPEMMSIDQIKGIAEQKVAELGLSDASDKGKLMAALMQELRGTAEGGDVKKVVDDLLS